MKFKPLGHDGAYKHQVGISLKYKETIIYLYTNDDNFNINNCFTCRRSLTIPTDIEGVSEDYNNSNGGTWKSWKEISDIFGNINSQGIIDITIDGVSINKKYEDKAKEYNFTMKFPLLYHFQIFKEDSNKVISWYPTSGATTLQIKDDKYSTKSIGYFDDFDELLKLFKSIE